MVGSLAQGRRAEKGEGDRGGRMAGMKPRLLDLFWGPAMGIDWMTSDELAEAIPPAYTEYIGYYLMAHLNAEKAAA
jgi:hypothetical protein